MPSVIFVCLANRCRSPMAEALFQKVVAERGESGEWRIDSAGVAALEGEPATSDTQRVAAERGMDVSAHRSRPANPEFLDPFGLILVMEEAHRRSLVETAPQLADRIYLLSEMVGEPSDIQDPVGTGLENYRAMADEIDRILRSGFDRVSSLAEATDDRGAATVPRRAGSE